jgi:hypothetical protein
VIWTHSRRAATFVIGLAASCAGPTQQGPAATAPPASASVSPQAGPPTPTPWRAELETNELARLARLPALEAAVARRIYQRAKVDGAFEDRIPTKPAEYALAEASVPAEWALALAPPAAPADPALLNALAADADEQIKAAAQAALLVGNKAPSGDRHEAEQALALAPLIGSAELVRYAPRGVRPADTEAWITATRIWDLIRKHPEPRASSELVAFAAANPHPYFRTQAALALAEIGDLRAAPLLAERLKQDPLKLYAGNSDIERRLRTSTDERISAARLLADLADLNHGAVPELRKAAEAALLSWLSEMPSPHANALRALVTLESNQVLKPLRGFAFPTSALPVSGQQPPLPEEWVVAQSALRYLGRSRDPGSFKKLTDQLARRPVKMDATMDGLMSGGNALLGMSLRAIGIGAAQGLAEWGDPRGQAALLRHIDDPLNNEQSRREACLALVWITPEAELGKLLDNALAASAATPDTLRRACLLAGFERRPRKHPALFSLMTGPDRVLGLSAARILGRAGLSKAEQAAALDRLPHDDKAHDRVALALLLGAEPEVAIQAVQSSRKRPGRGMELMELWQQSFGEMTVDDLDSGRLFRIVGNALSAGRELDFAGEQPWPTVLLGKALRDIVYESGPGTLTKTSIRLRLLHKAEKGPPNERRRALFTLALMDERGVLLSLVRDPGTGSQEPENLRLEARQALRFVDGKLRPILAFPPG